jgi:uncharacterized protein with von Willebrand factor type A (vWA) domain
MAKYIYSKWDGSEGDPDAEQILEQLGKNIFRYGDLERAIRALQRFGFKGQKGQTPSLEKLAERLRRLKQDQLKRYNLDSVMDEIKQKLDHILHTERQGIQKKLDEARKKSQSKDGTLEPEIQQRLLKHLEEMAAGNRAKLDALPPDTGGRIKELNRYDFMDEEARKQFAELMSMLKKQALEQYGKDLLENLKNMDPAALAGMRQMIESLNRMLEQRLKGETPDFEGFMQRFGSFFGGHRPRDLDELAEMLQEQIAQAQSLMESLSPEIRKQMEDLLDSMLDDATKFELARMASNLESLLPNDRMQRQYPFSGQESVSFEEAMKLMEELQKMDTLENQMKGVQYGSPLDSVDDELLAEVLGEEARRELETVREMTRRLEEAGYLKSGLDGYELSPKAIRKIGQQALDNIFSKLRKDRPGGHQNRRTGAGHERIEETKPYEFGDDFNVHIQKTVMNSLMRGPSIPVKLDVKDFEVMRTEESTRSATVLILDQSLSMFLNGYFEAAKRVSVALDSLIKTRFPKDVLHVVTFSRRAREVSEKELLLASPGQRAQGTNYQSALRLARKLLASQTCNNKEIILISDGEPTAHLERDEVYFEYPPSLRTLQMTMREVRACTVQHILINTFIFDASPFTAGFVIQMARLNKGRVFFADPDNLGEYILQDYLSNKRQKIN